jgi:hypothetical protein
MALDFSKLEQFLETIQWDDPSYGDGWEELDYDSDDEEEEEFDLEKAVGPTEIAAAKQRGLVPQTGNWAAPGRWVRSNAATTQFPEGQKQAVESPLKKYIEDVVADYQGDRLSHVEAYYTLIGFGVENKEALKMLSQNQPQQEMETGARKKAGLSPEISAAGKRGIVGRLKDFSGGDFTLENIQDMYSIGREDASFFIQEISGFDGFFDVDLQLFDLSHQLMAELKRTFTKDDDGNWNVEHGSFVVSKAFQKQNIATDINENAEEQYEKLGIKSISLNANLDIGGYAWARQGYDFADNENESGKIQLSEMKKIFQSALQDHFASLPYVSAKEKQQWPEEINAMEHAWEFANWNPEGNQSPGRHLGKRFLLGMSWAAEKKLNPKSLGYKIGKAYFAAKKQHAQVNLQKAEDIKFSTKAIITNDEGKFLILKDSASITGKLKKQQSTVPAKATYVENPKDAPEGLHVFTGPKGGHYFLPREKTDPEMELSGIIDVDLLAMLQDMYDKMRRSEKFFQIPPLMGHIRNELEHRLNADMQFLKDSLKLASNSKLGLLQTAFKAEAEQFNNELNADQLKGRYDDQKLEYQLSAARRKSGLVQDELQRRKQKEIQAKYYENDEWRESRRKEQMAVIEALGFELDFHETDRLSASISDDIGHDWISSSVVQRKAIKDKVVGGIVAKMADHPDMSKMETAWPWFSEDSMYEMVTRLIHTWAETSGDTDDLAVAIQLAANQVFNLEGTETKHWPKGTVFSAQNKLDNTGSFLQDFIRAQHEITQDWLASNYPDTHITVYRGAYLPPEHMSPEFEYVEGEVGEISLQPISSFSVDYNVASNFASHGEAWMDEGTATISAIRVPVDRVLSLPTTGFGCLIEGEVTILGDEYPSYIQNLGSKTRETFADLSAEVRALGLKGTRKGKND